VNLADYLRRQFAYDAWANEEVLKAIRTNAGENTPTLGYGMSITLGPFTCASSTAGITCTLGNGDGFRISSTAVTPLGSSTLALATTTTTTSG